MPAFIPTAALSLQHRPCTFTSPATSPATVSRRRVCPSPPRRPRLPPTCAASPPDPSQPAREVPFEIRGFSLANLGLLLGTSITVYSFSTYFASNGTASATSLGFVYGVPILLIGCALKYAELKPIPVSSNPSAQLARGERATDVQRKIYSDITRHRYGDEAHLAAVLAALGLVPRGEACPELLEGEESVGEKGEYRLKLTFYSVATPWKEWQGKIERYEQFFGPGVKVEVEKIDAEKRLVALTLSSRVEGEMEVRGGREEPTEATAGGVEAEA